jgi:hypothetical protein
MFEIVYTNDWCDGPQKGTADYQGKPHPFQSEWQDGENLDADPFAVLGLTERSRCPATIF